MSAGAEGRLDRASAVPLYRQIEQVLRDEFSGSNDGAARRLTENELIGRFKVSRHTVRQALSLLAAAGLIDRRPRRGTFARPQVPIEQPLSGMYSFVRSLRELGLPHRVKVISAQLVQGRNGLHDYLGSSRLVQLQRLHEVSDEPLVVETIWLVNDRVPGIVSRDLSGSLYELLHRVYALRVTSARESIRPVVLDQRQSRLLGVHRGCPAFFVERVSFVGAEALEVRHSLIRGDRYLYSIQLRAPGADDLPA